MPNKLLISAAVLLANAPAAHALEIYGSTGFPIFTVGVAQPVNEMFSVRADYEKSRSLSDGEVTEEGIRYNADGTFGRIGVFGDWFVLGGGFRVTGGLTFNDLEVNLKARSATGTINIGGQTFNLGTGDGFNVNVDFPRTTPYIGIGWGHQMSNSGWSFNADLGVSIGKPSVSAIATGQLANEPGIQQAIDQETRELRDGLSYIRAIPQISIGIGYRF